MRRDFSSLDLPPAVAAAHRRTPRHLRRRAEIPKNNYLAESAISHGKRLRNLRRPGAPSGNSNAVKPGAAERRLFLLYCSALIRETRALLALRALFVLRMKREQLRP